MQSAGRVDVLPVGKDRSGGSVCIGLVGAGRGHVLYHDYERERLVPLAEVLSAFLAGLR